MKRPIATLALLCICSFLCGGVNGQLEDANTDGVESLRGVLEPVSTLRLATRDSGVISKLNVKEGDVVANGQTIAILDSDIYKAEKDAAARELAIAMEESQNDVDLEYAKISSDVNKKVLDRSHQANVQFAKTVSRTELERLKLEYERARLSGEQAERTQQIKRLTQQLKQSQLKIAEIRLKNRTINSTTNGTVVEVLYREGEFVNGGYPIARLIDTSRLRVKCLASAAQIERNSISQSATFTYQKDGEEVSVPAKITFVSPEIDPVRQAYAVWAEIDNASGSLNPGTVGELKLLTNP